MVNSVSCRVTGNPETIFSDTVSNHSGFATKLATAARNAGTAAEFGGKFQIQSSGRGTKLMAVIPLQRDDSLLGSQVSIPGLPRHS